MASSDQGLVRRVTMALYIRFFSVSLKRISSISLSQKTPFLARSGEQGPVGMAHSLASRAGGAGTKSYHGTLNLSFLTFFYFFCHVFL